jgi:hypothetical protein
MQNLFILLLLCYKMNAQKYAEIIGQQPMSIISGLQTSLNSKFNISGGNITGNVGIGTISPSERLDINGNLKLNTAGNKIKIATGTNASIGTSTLVAGTVTVPNTYITSNSQIFLSVSTPACVRGYLSYSKIAGSSFTILYSSTLETSTIDWWIVN